MLSLGLRTVTAFTIAMTLASATAAVRADTAPAAARADVPTATPTLPPGSKIAPDGPGLQRLLEAARGGFASFEKSPDPRPTAQPSTTYDVPNLTNTRSCTLTVPDDTSDPHQVSCRVEDGNDLMLADEVYAALTSEFASLTKTGGKATRVATRFLVIQSTSFALRDGVTVTVDMRTRVDPHIRMIQFDITSPVRAPKPG